MRIERIMFSESTDWRGIKLDKTATPGNLIHIALTDIDAIDVVYLWAENTGSGGGTTKAVVTVEFGGVAKPADLMVREVPLHSALRIVNGRSIKGDALEIRAFTDLSNEVNVWGYINRIYE